MNTEKSTLAIQQLLDRLHREYDQQEKTLSFESGDNTISGEILLEKIDASALGAFCFYIGYCELEVIHYHSVHGGEIPLDSPYGLEFIRLFFHQLSVMYHIPSFDIFYGETHYRYENHHLHTVQPHGA
jgi:hypothetical protein